MSCILIEKMIIINIYRMYVIAQRQNFDTTLSSCCFPLQRSFILLQRVELCAHWKEDHGVPAKRATSPVATSSVDLNRDSTGQSSQAS